VASGVPLSARSACLTTQGLVPISALKGEKQTLEHEEQFDVSVHLDLKIRLLKAGA
jgi:hypothetical protein